MTTRKNKREEEKESLEPPTKKIKVKTIKTNDGNSWKIFELVSELEEIDVGLSKTIVSLFEDDFTIPFLCRYRKDLIDDLSPLKLREIKKTIDNVKQVEVKSQSLMKSLAKENLLTDEISRSIGLVKSIEELEHLSQLYKPASKGSLYERALKLGLESSANNILFGSKKADLSKLVDTKTAGLKTIKEIEENIKNIMSHCIAKNEHVMNEVQELKNRFSVTVSTTQTKAKKTDPDKESSKNINNAHKFENYFNFSCPANRIKPHQILAINRGESLKVLTIKYEIDERFQQRLKTFATNLFLKKGLNSPERTKLFNEAIADAYRKKISPFIVRQVVSDLARKAEASAIEVFATNLKNLLLTNPVKGKKILGIDPGFTSGCKLAMISETGELLETGQVIYPHDKNRTFKAESIVTNLLNKFQCSLIALGNATACRETECFISELIKTKHPKVQYCIVSEQGASIYSCSDLAKKEFPNLDVSFIGAISIARRLLDPLCELVKIEPKHLGVGMYQHDINEKSLKSTLDEVITECVSFVGVDLNVANVSLLKHVAGLNEKKAQAIEKYREENGCFKSRADLLKVKSIGPKSFTQCAGFVRINRLSSGLKINLLDSTNVHPESYDIATAIVQECSLKIEDIGQPSFVEKVLKYAKSHQLEKIAQKFKEKRERISTVLDALSQELLHDYRSDIKIEPVFKKSIADITALTTNHIVTGVVTNITDFGAFIDIGVGKNGLIHSSAMRNAKLKVSDKVECKVLQVEVSKGRIGLEFKSIL